MPGGASVLSIKVMMDTKDAVAGMKGLGDATAPAEVKFDGLGKKLVGIGAALGGLSAVKEFGGQILEAATQAQTAGNNMAAVFGKWSEDQSAIAAGAAVNMGISRTEYMSTATTVGAAMIQMGDSQDLASEKTAALIQRGSDLAAAMGVDGPTAIEAMNSALRGETDSLGNLGVQVDGTKSATEIYAEIMEKTTGVAGAFTDGADELASSQATANARWEDAQAALGEKMLPAVTTITQAISGMVDWLSQNTQVVWTGVAAIAAIVAVVTVYKAVLLATEIATKASAAATKIAAAGQWLWNAALTANPIGLIIAVIAAVIAIVVMLYNKFEGVRNVVDSVVHAVVSAWQWLMNKLQPIIDAVGGFFSGIGQFFGWSADFQGTQSWRVVQAAGGGFSAAAGGAPWMSVGTRSRISVAPATTVNVTFSGVVGDPVAVGKQISTVMDRYTRSRRY